DCFPSELGVSAARPDRLTARLHIAPPLAGPASDRSGRQTLGACATRQSGTGRRGAELGGSVHRPKPALFWNATSSSIPRRRPCGNNSGRSPIVDCHYSGRSCSPRHHFGRENDLHVLAGPIAGSVLYSFLKVRRIGEELGG